MKISRQSLAKRGYKAVFALQGSGNWETARGVFSENFQKRLPCSREPMPVSSETDLLLAKAEPVSHGS